MDDFKKLLIGLVLFAITSVIAYLFKMRQLYVSIPRLYNKSQLSTNGSLCEIKVFNKGNHSEEDITIAFDPKLSIELLATDDTTLSINDNKIQIPRLHKHKDVSALLMVEGGSFEHSKITDFSSKATTGRILNPNEDTPPNWAATFVFAMIFMSIFPGIFYGFELYKDYQASSAKEELKAVVDAGWVSLGGYYKSPIRKSYSDKEFPILIKKTTKDKNGNEFLIIQIINKTGLNMTVNADAKGYKSGAEVNIDYWATLDTAPLSTNTGLVKLPKSNGNGSILNVEFNIRTDDDFLYGIVYELSRKP